jgi:mono/diheme cytochrome c family protein
LPRAVTRAPPPTGSTLPSSVPRWIELEHLPKQATRGAVVFATSGCTACHTYAGSGNSNLGAPDLTAIGRRKYGIRFLVRQLQCPSCIRSGSAMPAFRSLGEKRLHELAVFLDASKGTH